MFNVECTSFEYLMNCTVQILLSKTKLPTSKPTGKPSAHPTSAPTTTPPLPTHESPCMDTVWKSLGHTQDLVCTAKDVYTEATYVEGPATCERGSIITVNVTASIHFHATRYDFAMYTYTGTMNSDPVFGETCAIDILNEDDVGSDGGNGVYDLDGDICFDVVAHSGWTMTNFSFQENLEVPCEFGDDESERQTVHIQNCFSWRTHGQNNQGNDNLDCDQFSAAPGSPSKCDCSFMDIGIPVESRRNDINYLYSLLLPPPRSLPQPSVSGAPTFQPSDSPSLSAEPSSSPSDSPSVSGKPSSSPSDAVSLIVYMLLVFMKKQVNAM
eukprot:scaffold13350_cov270-Alexandrium_tamarense.AAC.2